MAVSHPYISGPGNIASMIAQLRKNFPGTITSDTVKKLGLAPNNESYVINALQFLGIIDKDGKKTTEAAKIFTSGDDEFKKGFEKLVRNAYKELFELRHNEAWTLDKEALTQYFRQADQTSETIGQRQAGVFQTFAALAGHGEVKPIAKGNGKSTKTTATQKVDKKTARPASPSASIGKTEKNGVALSVRIEINLPSGGTQETYDAIFKSIRANLIDE